MKRSNKIYNYVATNGTLKINDTGKTNNNGDLQCDEKNSFYLGRHILRNGDRHQHFRRSPDPMMEFYHNHKEVFQESGVDVDKAVVINGCFKSNKETLQRTMIPQFSSEFSSYPSMKLIKKKSSAIKSVIRKLKITQLAKCEKLDMIDSNFNLDTYPGFTYAEYLKLKTKRDALPVAFKVANQRWDNIEESTLNGKIVQRNKLYPNTFVVGARNKREMNYEDGDQVTSRAVHMPEFHSELNSAVWLDQISQEIKDRGHGCIYIGNSLVKSERLQKDLENAISICEGDIKWFDASLYITDIIIATALSRLFYDLDDFSIDNHFVAIFDTVAIKDYYTPGGYIYRMIHGLPSGVKSTSLFGSLINLVNLNYAFDSWDLKRTKFIVGSDDFLVSCEYDFQEDDLEFVKEKTAQIGIIFKILKLKSLNAEKLDDRPVFYKYTLDRGEPVVPTSVILERVFVPWNKNYKNDFDIMNFLYDLIPSLGAPRSSCLLFYYFFRDVYFKCTNVRMSIADVYSLHLSKYVSVMRSSIPHRTNLRMNSRPLSSSGIKFLTSSIEIPPNFNFCGENDITLYPSFVTQKLKIGSL